MTSSAANTACGNPYPGVVHATTSARAGRFFVWAFLLLCQAPALAQDHAIANNPDQASCRSGTYDEKATVKHVIDGDTIILADDRHVRLIGINTPEVSHDNFPSQPGADQAHRYLDSLVRTHKTIHLHYDQERTDHYGRTLAHLFLPDGTNIQSLLLIRGLATTLTIPPNLEFLDCYAASAGQARDHGIGLWALRQYQPLPVEFITRKELGYRTITGTILRVTAGKSSSWFSLAKNMSLRIDNDDLQYFSDLQALVGKQVMASGFLYYSSGEFRMKIRHPLDLQTVSTPDRN
ncbi:MAG: thermonuclease family protein [Gammaproteobacteria bacterium]